MSSAIIFRLFNVTSVSPLPDPDQNKYAAIIVTLFGKFKLAEAEVGKVQKLPSRLFSAGFKVLPIAV